MMTGIILAGGRSQRLGRDKAKEEIGGVPILHRAVSALAAVSREVIVVGGDPGSAPEEIGKIRVRFVSDAIPDRGPLGGLYSGLSAAAYPYAWMVACDMPFLNPSLLRLLMDLAPGHQAVVPLVAGTPQTAHAVYATDILEAVEETLRDPGSGIQRLLPRLKVRYVEEYQLRTIDPDLLSFVNVNTEEELVAARALWEHRVNK